MRTGLINFNENTCVFKLKGFELEIEEIENRDNIRIYDLKFMFDESSRNNETPDILKGRDFENSSKEIVFNIRNGGKTSPRTYTFTLNSYIIFEKDECSFDFLSISGDELNWFYNVKNAYNYTAALSTGQINFETVPFKGLEKCFEFDLDGESISGELNISRQVFNMSISPIRLRTNLYLSFKGTKDYTKIHQLINVTANFLKFVNYRKNISINNISLGKKDENTNERNLVGHLYVNRETSNFVENEKILKERTIDLSLIEESLGFLFNKLQKNMIYLTHIPENSVDKHTITPSRFVLITAGFEWQFRISYKELSNQAEEEDKKSEGKEELLEFLELKIQESSGKKKKYFKGLRKRIIDTDMSLSSKINWALEEFQDILAHFIKKVYKMNQIEDVRYLDIAERIQNQRNNYAHGNIDRELNPVVILDLIVLEWIYYSMVLSDIGVSRNNIKKAINKLFSRGYGL
ncbi:HEPN domain-containing protein [Priestia aryabhattai]|uniref:HEPN domain-containing protein n=1 Tax=Priestia aryabhattai TaxID=412384 RepID=UPI003D28EECB